MSIIAYEFQIPIYPPFSHSSAKIYHLEKTTLQIGAKMIQYNHKRTKGGQILKIRTEISDSEEIIIRCRKRTDKIISLESAIEAAIRGENEISLFSDGVEHFVPKSSILYFESSEGKVYAHTADCIYTTPHKLFELESIMPSSFTRVSKSTIANIAEISYLRRELVGNGEMGFRRSDKKVYFSRAYFKLLQYKIDEMRLKNEN